MSLKIGECLTTSSSLFDAYTSIVALHDNLLNLMLISKKSTSSHIFNFYAWRCIFTLLTYELILQEHDRFNFRRWIFTPFSFAFMLKHICFYGKIMITKPNTQRKVWPIWYWKKEVFIHLSRNMRDMNLWCASYHLLFSKRTQRKTFIPILFYYPIIHLKIVVQLKKL